jgi:hypothetical protein
MSEVSICYGPVASGLLCRFTSGHHLVDGVSVVACELWFRSGGWFSGLVLVWC